MFIRIIKYTVQYNNIAQFFLYGTVVIQYIALGMHLLVCIIYYDQLNDIVIINA